MHPREIRPGILQYKFPMHQWNIELDAIVTDEGAYFVIGQLCTVFGISRHSSMITRMQDDEILAEFMKKLPVATAGGVQTLWCIHKRAVGYWMAFINTNRVRPEIRPTLTQLKRDAMNYLERAVFGEVDAISSSSPIVPASVPFAQDIDTLYRYTMMLEERIEHIEEKFPTSDDEG